MPQLLKLKTFSDDRGNLSVLEDHQVPFAIKRLFYIYGVDDSERGGHRHKKTHQALITLRGSCKVFVDTGAAKTQYSLVSPQCCLVLEPADWHTLYEFAPGTILLVCASEYFDENDYIYEKYS